MGATTDISRPGRQGGEEIRVGRDARLEAIAETVMSAGSVRIEELAESFGVSLMTVHRDLDKLAAQGLLRKTRGMATALASTLAESSTEYRKRINTCDKAALATVDAGLPPAPAAPHLSALALRFRPERALADLRRAAEAGASGPRDQAMSLAAVANLTCDDVLVQHFHQHWQTGWVEGLVYETKDFTP